ncbi:MAG: LruC domain-containing protein [bacterium]
MKKLLVAMVLVILAFLFSCESMIDSNNDVNENGHNKVSEGFNFNTTQGIDVVVKTLDDQGQPVSHVKFDVLMNGNVISSGMTKSDGQFKTYVDCPTSTSALEIFTKNPNYYGKQKVAIINDQALFTYDGYVQTEESDNPMTKLAKTSSSMELDPDGDEDGDGVLNKNDDYPEDADKAWNNKVSGTLAFEDLWPKLGDYDFNDLVVNYELNRITKYDDSKVYDPVTYLEGSFVIVASGAAYDVGFGLELSRLPKDNAEIVVNGTTLPDGVDKSLEDGQDSPVIILSNSINDDLFGSNKKVNTYSNRAYVNPSLDTLKVEFKINPNAYYTLSTLGTPPYNPFIIVPGTGSDGKRLEVHMIYHAPTTLGTQSKWQSQDDDSQPDFGIYYRDLYGLPWAINLPEEFKYPEEKTDIRDAYDDFWKWFSTDGQEYKEWYKSPNNSEIYTAP